MKIFKNFALEEWLCAVTMLTVPDVTSSSRSVDPSALSEMVFACSSYNSARFDNLICCCWLSPVYVLGPRLAQLRNPMDRIMFLDRRPVIVAMGSILFWLMVNRDEAVSGAVETIISAPLLLLVMVEVVVFVDAGAV